MKRTAAAYAAITDSALCVALAAAAIALCLVALNAPTPAAPNAPHPADAPAQEFTR